MEEDYMVKVLRRSQEHPIASLVDIFKTLKTISRQVKVLISCLRPL